MPERQKPEWEKVTIQLIKEQKEALSKLSERTRVPLSEYFREAIDDLIQKYGGKIPREVWECQENPEHQYDEPGDGFCKVPGCNGIVLSKQTILPLSLASPREEYTGDHGLGILVLDLSGSMGEKAFPEGGNPARKIDLVARALGVALPRARLTVNADYAYVAMIGFSETAELIGIYQASKLNEDPEYWANFVKDQHEKHGNQTNITDALQVTYELYKSALDGTFDTKYGINGFSLGSQDIVMRNMEEVRHVPNIRVFIYSDGEHNVGKLKNPFASESLIPDIMGINGIISAFFGTSEKSGFLTMKDIAGICPVHNVKGLIHVENPRVYPLFRYLYHMTSAHSGFCPSCAKTWQEVYG